MALSALTFGVAPTAAHAQAAAKTQAQTLHDFDIPAGALSTALTRACLAAGVSLTADAALTAGKAAPALKGRMTLREALARLLVGTGLEAVTQPGGAYTVRKAGDASAASAAASGSETLLPVVRVRGAPEGNGLLVPYEARVASSGALGTKAILDTPFSIHAVTATDIADRQAGNLADVYRGDASVVASSNSIARESSMIAVRGLPVDMLNGFKVDGLNVSSWNTDLPLEHFEQVELLKGLSGFMYGFAEPGGVVNYKLKRAGAAPVTALTASVGTRSQQTAGVDIGRRFADGRLGVRIDAVHEGGDTYLDTPIRRDSVSLALDARLTERLTLELDTLYQKRKVHGSMFAMVLGDGLATPMPIAGDTRLTQDFTYHQTELSTSGIALNWALDDGWNLRVAARTAQDKRTNYDSWISVDDDAGNYSDWHLAWYSEHKNESANLLLSGRFATGDVQHDLVVGSDLQTVKRSGTTDVWSPLASGNLYVGRGSASDPLVPRPTDLAEMQETRNVGIFASDTVRWSAQWSTVLGLRHSNYRKTQADGPTYEKHKLTPTLAAIWKPVESTSVYASYVEAIEEGNTAPVGTVNADEVFGPLESKQYELGIKQQSGWWSAEAALFRVERGLAYTNSTNVFVQEGGLVFHGLDVSGRFELDRDWALRASAQLLRSTNRSDDAGVNGKNAANAPRVNAALHADYRVPGLEGLVLTGGMRHVGKRYLEASNTHALGSYQLLDLGARRTTKLDGRTLTLRAGVSNLTNRKYWQSHGDWNWLTPGEPRTFRASVQLDF